jgi:uncharacterized membrane protein YgcG
LVKAEYTPPAANDPLAQTLTECLDQLKLDNNTDGGRYMLQNCYQSWLGFYNSFANSAKLNWGRVLLVQYAQRFSDALHANDELGRAPLIPDRTLAMMRLNAVEGIGKGQPKRTPMASINWEVPPERQEIKDRHSKSRAYGQGAGRGGSGGGRGGRGGGGGYGRR